MIFAGDYFDFHTHLHDHAFESDREEVAQRLSEISGGAITVGTDYQSSMEAIACAKKYKKIFATVGVHPTDSTEVFSLERYLPLAKEKEVVAIGECGLDYFHELDLKKRAGQTESFLKQVSLAREVGKPLMIHCRPSSTTFDAYESLLAILKNLALPKVPMPANIHFFAGNVSLARAFLDLGFSLSFTGVITFTNDYEELIKFVPKERLFLETDAPYVAPKPYRGKRNEPAYIKFVYEKAAAIKGEELVDFCKTLKENVNSFLNQDKTTSSEH